MRSLLLLSSALTGCSDYFLDGENRLVNTAVVSESFTQAPLPAVDVLFVIDSTGSMAEEQAGFGSAAGGFVDVIETLGLDYQIGVISMDLDDGGALLGVPWILTPSQDGVSASLARNLVVGTGSAPPSMGLDCASLALTDPTGVNTGFRRSDAALHVIFVSDGDDESGEVLGADPVAAFAAQLADAAAATGRSARASAVVGDVPDGCTGSGGTALPGARYMAVAEASGGTVASICAGDFTAVGSDVGSVVADWQLSFPLQGDPLDGSVTVTLDGVRAGSGWVIDHAGPSLVFQTAPPPDAFIEVTYSLAGV